MHVLKLVWVPFPFSGLRYALFLTHHRLAATQITAFCVIYTFMDADEGCGDLPPIPLKHALACLTFYLVCLEVVYFDKTL